MVSLPHVSQAAGQPYTHLTADFLGVPAVKLDDQSSDFDPTSDKAAERALATKVMLEVAPNVT